MQEPRQLRGKPTHYRSGFKSFYDAYKSAAGLLTSEEIVAIRKKHGLFAERFAPLLGFGAKTVMRYENGAIQSKEADYLIPLARRDDVARKLSEWSGVFLDRKKAKIPTRWENLGQTPLKCSVY